MTVLWIPLTILAAFLQNLRSMLQKAIRDRLSTAGAAYARFLYALPFAVVAVFLLDAYGGVARPEPNARFFVYCALGGLLQILFTVILLWLFSFRSFAVGTTLSKLEVVLIAGLGAVVLGDTVGPLGLLAIAIGAAGALVLSLDKAKLSWAGLRDGLGTRATLGGLLCAACLGASAVFFRGAILSLGAPDFVPAALLTLAVALGFQTVMMGAWFLIFDRAELGRTFREWRRAAPIGLVGMVCTSCWFMAFALQNAAYVRALGQVELVFTILAGVFVFREAVTPTEVLGIGLVVAAILLILLAG